MAARVWPCRGRVWPCRGWAPRSCRSPSCSVAAPVPCAVACCACACPCRAPPAGPSPPARPAPVCRARPARPAPPPTPCRKTLLGWPGCLCRDTKPGLAIQLPTSLSASVTIQKFLYRDTHCLLPYNTTQGCNTPVTIQYHCVLTQLPSHSAHFSSQYSKLYCDTVPSAARLLSSPTRSQYASVYCDTLSQLSQPFSFSHDTSNGLAIQSCNTTEPPSSSILQYT